MIQIITRSLLRKIIKDAFYRGLDKGYVLGHQAGIAEAQGKGVILEGQAGKELGNILKEKEF